MQGERRDGRSPSKYEQLKDAVESALIGKEDSWTNEERSSKFQEIKKDAQDLRKKLYDRQIRQGEESPLVEMTYNAATRMTDGLKELLERPLQVANVPRGSGESGIDKRYINHSRNIFVNSLLDVLEETNISVEDLNKAREKREEVDRRLGSLTMLN